MEVLELTSDHKEQPVGTVPKQIAANITDDCFLKVDGVIEGFYMSTVPSQVAYCLGEANKICVRHRKTRYHRHLADSYLVEMATEVQELIKRVLGHDIGYSDTVTCYNSPATYHIDRHATTLNACVVARTQATGGNITIPSLGVTFDQCHASIVVFPAWKYFHGVTEISGEYRNSFIFYSMASKKVKPCGCD